MTNIAAAIDSKSQLPQKFDEIAPLLHRIADLDRDISLQNENAISSETRMQSIEKAVRALVERQSRTHFDPQRIVSA